jgi:hypothetical protein
MYSSRVKTALVAQSLGMNDNNGCIVLNDSVQLCVILGRWASYPTS